MNNRCWRKGLTEETDERIRNIGLKRRGIPKPANHVRKIREGILKHYEKLFQTLLNLYPRTEAEKLKELGPFEIQRRWNIPYARVHQIYDFYGIKMGTVKGIRFRRGSAKETNPLVKKISDKLKGRVGIWRGLTKETNPSLMKSSLKQKGRKKPREQVEKQRASLLRYMESNSGFWTNTIPEQTVKKYLGDVGIKFVQSKNIHKFLVDFLLSELNTIIEVDGCIYHACEKCYPEPDGWICKTREDVINRHHGEAIRENKLRDFGYKIIRIFEHDITRSEKYKNIILTKLGRLT